MTNTTREMAGDHPNFAVAADEGLTNWQGLADLSYTDYFQDKGFRLFGSTTNGNNFCVTDAKRATAHGCTADYNR